jgi:hypothetical protein
MNFSKGSILFVIFAAIVAVVPASEAAICSNASVKGVYGIAGSGLNGSSQPAADVTQVTLDGAGNGTGTQTKSIDGQLVTYTLTATYHINKNCTGTSTWTNQNHNIEHNNFFLNNGNKGAFLIQTDAVHVHTGVAVSLGNAVCTNLGVEHRYSMELTGIVKSVGQVAMAGQLVLNGSGSITGTATLSLNGNIQDSLPVTGIYEIKSDCSGTAQFTPHGLPAVNLALLVVNADKEILAVETDSGTIVSGELQQ